MNIKNDSLENIILNALWYLEDNYYDLIDVSSIQIKINSNNKKWAYTTVKTVLDRLVEKKIVSRVKQGKKYFYRSRLSRVLAGEAAIQNLLNIYYNGKIEELLKAVEKVQNEMFLAVK